MRSMTEEGGMLAMDCSIPSFPPLRAGCGTMSLERIGACTPFRAPSPQRCVFARHDVLSNTSSGAAGHAWCPSSLARWRLLFPQKTRPSTAHYPGNTPGPPLHSRDGPHARCASRQQEGPRKQGQGIHEAFTLVTRQPRGMSPSNSALLARGCRVHEAGDGAADTMRTKPPRLPMGSAVPSPAPTSTARPRLPLLRTGFF